jgi:uncharacterized repeat protein (TIGR02543 family)
MANSHLYALAQAFGKKTTPPGAQRSKGVSWINACGALVYQFSLYIGGWSKAPSVTGPYAATVAAHSGTLNTDYKKAPINAKHFFALSGSVAGHTGDDLNGGGTDLIMATGRAVKVRLASYLGIQSVPGYVATGGVKYLGWATNYGGGVSKYVEPKAAPVLTAGQRVTVAAGANVRDLPDEMAPSGVPLKGNTIVTIAEYVEGVAPKSSTNKVWFVVPGGYAWSGGFTSASVTNLKLVKVDYTVTFDAAGGAPTPARQTVEDGALVKAPSPEPTREGFTLEGWDDGETPFVFTEAVHDNLTLKAVWEPVPPPVVVPPADSGDSGQDSGDTGPIDSGEDSGTEDSGSMPTPPTGDSGEADSGSADSGTPTKPSAGLSIGAIVAIIGSVLAALAALILGH